MYSKGDRIKSPLFKTGDIVKLQDEYRQDWKLEFPGIAVILEVKDGPKFVMEDDSISTEGYVYKLLTGDTIQDYHECYLEGAKDNDAAIQ